MKKGRSSRRYSDDDYEDDKPRRGEYDDGYRSDGHHDQGFRSDAYRRHGRGDGHTRFDGGDDAGFDEINNRPRRQRSRNARYDDDDDRYGYGDGHRPPFRDTNPRKPRAQKQSHYPDPVPRHQGPPEWPPMGYYAAPAAMGDAATMNASSAYGSPIPGTHAGAQSTSSLRGGISTGYVPYAHIYGGPTHPQSNFGVFAPPPKSEQGSVQPSHVNQVASPERSRPAIKRPPAGYQQNPLAQEAPAGNQPGYLVDPNSRDYDERQDDYSSENERQQSRSPPRRRRSRLEHSQDRHRSPESRDGRHSSRRERSRHDDRAKSHGRGKLLMKENIETSQRGSGYTAVGALAGGRTAGRWAQHWKRSPLFLCRCHSWSDWC